MTATLDRDPVQAADERAGFDRTVALLGLFARWLYDRRDRVQISYLIPERSGFGWYVVGKQPAFDFALNKELTEFGNSLIRRGYFIHATLLPGAVGPSVPRDGIVVTPAGQVLTRAE